MLITKLLLALGIGFAYTFMSVASLIAGTSAIVQRGVRGGLTAGAGSALGMGVYSAVAIAGLGLVQYFLRPVHLAVIEIVLAVLFVATGYYLIARSPRPKKRPLAANTHAAHGRLWPYFVTNLTLLLSSPQKIAYIAGLFLFFNLHISRWSTKAMLPVAVMLGSCTAWSVYSFAVAHTRKRIIRSAVVQRGLERLGRFAHCRLFLAFRRAWVQKHLARRLIWLGKVLLIVIGLALAVKGILLLGHWGLEPWKAGSVRG